MTAMVLTALSLVALAGCRSREMSMDEAQLKRQLNTGIGES